MLAWVGSLPNWLIGLPMLAGASYSPTACLPTVVVWAPTRPPNMFFTDLLIVTFTCVGRSPWVTLTVTPFWPSL